MEKNLFEKEKRTVKGENMNLLLLTKFYPFGTGEAFIENEIKVAAEYYDQIMVIACEVPEGENIIRRLPINVKAYKVTSQSKKTDVMRGILKITPKTLSYKKEKELCNTLLKKCFLDYFEEKCQRIYKSIMELGCMDQVTQEPYVLYSYWFFMTARVGTLIAENYKPVKMITRAHRYDLYENENKIGYLPYRKLFLEKYDYVFPCSDNGTTHLKTLYPQYSKNVETSFLGTLDHGVGKASNDGVFRIVSCSRVEPVKRVERIIDALAELDKKNVNIEWTHVGDGSGYERIKKYAEEKLHNIKVVFRGNMKNEDIMELYSTHPFDLFVNVSSSEGLPVSIMEALSFGMPCIATDVGGTSEIVIDGVTGKLISSEFETRTLSSDILKFIENGEGVIDRNLCRRFWKNHFQAISNYHKLYKKLEICVSKSNSEG